MTEIENSFEGELLASEPSGLTALLSVGWKVHIAYAPTFERRTGRITALSEYGIVLDGRHLIPASRIDEVRIDDVHPEDERFSVRPGVEGLLS